ncbi:MAG: hypothetical protein WCE30_12655, partial [Mycobacterium sp.]
MTERQRATSFVGAACAAMAGIAITGGALMGAGQALADPPQPNPAPSGPGAAAPPPGQPVLNAADGPVGPPPPPPNGAPPVPEIQDPQYGAGSTPGQLGYLRDIWHTFHSGNPIEALTMPPEQAPGPPPSAGPAPKLPPGYTSLTDPASSTPATDTGPKTGGPALPPGYYPLNGPPPPGWTGPVPGA